MTSRTPSYLTRSRHGIWYFQLWIPESYRLQSQSNRKLIRRSLKTRDRVVAMARARFLWVYFQGILQSKEIQMVDKKSAAQEIEAMNRAIERDMDSQNQKYRLGAKIAGEITRLGINPKDEFALDSYFETIPSDQTDAYFWYLEHKENLKAESNVSATPEIPVVGPSNQDSPVVNELIKSWLSFLRTKERAASTLDDYGRILDKFHRIISEYCETKSPKLHQITPDAVRDYKKVRIHLPKGTKYSAKNFHDLSRQEAKKNSPRTIQNECTIVGTFFKWLDAEGYEIHPKNLTTITANLPEITPENTKDRVPFELDDLRKILGSKKFVTGKCEFSADYWVPLIAMFTGAALAELVQLYVSDIRKEQDIWVYDINYDADKRLKNKQARKRVVPIHPQLIKLGLLEYVDFRKSQEHFRLFPEEERDHRDAFSKFSKRFRYLVAKVGAGPRQDMEFRDFHSFRHLARTELSRIGVTQKVNDSITGHKTPGQSEGDITYDHNIPLVEMHKAVKKMKFDLDFESITPWRLCTFARIKLKC